MNIGDFVEKHKGVRRTTLAWLVCVVTFVVFAIYTQPSTWDSLSVPFATITVSIITGFFTTAGFYFWRRGG
jgi:hypothetical protein